MGDPYRRSRAPETAGPTLAGECTAFLSGDYLDYIRECGALGRIPRSAWMILNTVAHGSPERVRQLAALSLPIRGDQTTWHQCRSQIAAALVDKCRDSDADLARLQIDALVPLELALIDEVDVTPQLLIQLSLLALEVQTLDGT
ncbi:MAG TPA: hypothetical protein VFY84_14390 [Jiangellales bacterium]|nr:hypothetical protein [Jiangellales bacterium]